MRKRRNQVKEAAYAPITKSNLYGAAPQNPVYGGGTYYNPEPQFQQMYNTAVLPQLNGAIGGTMPIPALNPVQQVQQVQQIQQVQPVQSASPLQTSHIIRGGVQQTYPQNMYNTGILPVLADNTAPIQTLQGTQTIPPLQGTQTLPPLQAAQPIQTAPPVKIPNGEPEKEAPPEPVKYHSQSNRLRTVTGSDDKQSVKFDDDDKDVKIYGSNTVDSADDDFEEEYVKVFETKKTSASSANPYAKDRHEQRKTLRGELLKNPYLNSLLNAKEDDLRIKGTNSGTANTPRTPRTDNEPVLEMPDISEVPTVSEISKVSETAATPAVMSTDTENTENTVTAKTGADTSVEVGEPVKRNEYNRPYASFLNAAVNTGVNGGGRTGSDDTADRTEKVNDDSSFADVLSGFTRKDGFEDETTSHKTRRVMEAVFGRSQASPFIHFEDKE
jgi:hypothetical protein